MKTATGGFIAWLAQQAQEYGQMLVADLFTITLPSGAVLRYTSYDRAIVYGGNTWLPGPPYITRQTTSSTIGLETATHQVTFALPSIYSTDDQQPTVSGVPMVTAFLQKQFNLASYTYQWIYSAGPGQAWQGTVTMFGGLISNIDEISRTMVKFTVKSVGDQLTAQFPVHIIQPQCGNTLFDVGCTLVASSFTVASTAASGSTVNTINCSLSQAAGYFDQGYIQFTSGALTGLRRMVRTYTPGVFLMAQPWTVAPAIGDAFTAYPGCDKQLQTCQGTKTGSFQLAHSINNQANFQGYPYVPSPETAT